MVSNKKKNALDFFRAPNGFKENLPGAKISGGSQ